jgi:P27 family predicted phage terminase small subunit
MAAQRKIHVPKTLSAPTRRWFEQVAETFVLESHHLRILELAGRSWDRAEEARAILKKEGLTTLDRYKQVKPHPAVNIERDSQLRFARLIRELALDVEPPASSRPPRTGGQRW